MALTLPQLDDRRFNDLVAELRSLIPRYDRTWTNHNPADPGMTLVELFAWLAEMVIYRLNRIEDRTYRTFLELLGVQPAAPQTTVTFELRISLADGFVIPQGTRTAAYDEDTGEEILFETLAAAPLSLARWDADQSAWVFKAPAVNTIDVEYEFLGFGTAKPNQELALKSMSLFLDRENEQYRGNPKVFVDDGISVTSWVYRRDLLDSGGSAAHFTVEHLANLVRFGDGSHGAIPPEGAKIFCSYRKLGNTRGNVKANSIKQLKDPIGIADSSLVTVVNEYPAEGGVDQETLDDLLTLGLSLMAERSRAVSQEDFEALAKQAAPGRVARANVIFDRNLAGDPLVEADAHVSVIVLPAAGYLWPEEQSMEQDPDADAVLLRHTCADLSAEMAGSNRAQNLYLDIFAFLDKRRLVTTMVHVVGPSFTPLSMTMMVRAKLGVNVAALSVTVRKKIGRFLDPYAGWLDEQGWPFGRKIYRSELYQQIEGIEGVDHVETLLINGDAAGSAVDVGEFSLVCLSDLNVTVR